VLPWHLFPRNSFTKKTKIERNSGPRAWGTRGGGFSSLGSKGACEGIRIFPHTTPKGSWKWKASAEGTPGAPLRHLVGGAEAAGPRAKVKVNGVIIPPKSLEGCDFCGRGISPLLDFRYGGELDTGGAYGQRSILDAALRPQDEGGQSMRGTNTGQ